MNAFDISVRQHWGKDLVSDGIRSIQVNLGLRCNLTCRHCHLEAGPGREEVMEWPVMESILRLARHFPGCLIDLTGGAPELNPHLIPFIEAIKTLGHPVQVRTNLTVLEEPGKEQLPEFFKNQRVQLVASLPCYLGANVQAQRGEGVYDRSIAVLRKLNTLGYGRAPDLLLNLVYNPGGPFLPPLQTSLEDDYRRELQERFGIVFSRLLTIINMPLGRFAKDLRQRGKEDAYLSLLRESFNSETIEGLMCRHQICVTWDGTLADCDFNQALGLKLSEGIPLHIDDLDPASLKERRIVTGNHCFACTAGAGSSCGGALVA